MAVVIAQTIHEVPSLLNFLQQQQEKLGIHRHSWSLGEADYTNLEPSAGFKVVLQPNDEVKNHLYIGVSVPPAEVPAWVKSLLDAYEQATAGWGEVHVVLHYVYQAPKPEREPEPDPEVYPTE